MSARRPVSETASVTDERPLETGWLPDTPVGDTVLRRFLYNQSDLNAEIARAAGGRVERGAGLALADAGGPIPYFNQAILLRPLTDPADSALDEVERFFGEAAKGRPATLLSIWPTPDLGSRGWSLVGHPAFVVRGAVRHEHTPATGVGVRVAESVDDLAAVERIVVEGYPMDEARGLPPGAVFPPGLLGRDVILRLGLLEDEPVAAGGRYIGHGVVNLCLAATLASARRRGVWEALVWARVADAPDLPAVAFTSDYSRPGFERMGFLPMIRFTLWARDVPS